jgi:hypothetical protein
VGDHHFGIAMLVVLDAWQLDHLICHEADCH